MAKKAKAKDTVKDSFVERINAVTKETANDLYVDLNESELSEAVKQDLNIALQAKLNVMEQAELDAAGKPLDEAPVSVPSDESAKPKAKGSLPSWVKAVSATEEQVMKYQEKGRLYGHDPVKGIAYILASLLIALMVLAPASFAGSTDRATLGGIYSGDTYDCAVDSQGDFACQGDVQAGASADLKFRSNLIATGRYNGNSLEMQSSSTPIGATQLAYSVIQKRIGGAGGLDNTDGGTRLANGTPGQIISMIAIYVEANGSWVITPVTKTGFSTITMDALKEHATLLYVNDTVGWIIIGSNATIA